MFAKRPLKRPVLILGVVGLTALGSAACIPDEISVPITGRLSDGTLAAGEATSRRDGHGALWVQIPGGFRCEGKYNSLERSASVVVPVTCSNGLKGEAVVAIQLDRMSGTALVRLSDGRRGQFVFGNLSFEQAFGAGGRVKTKPVS